MRKLPGLGVPDSLTHILDAGMRTRPTDRAGSPHAFGEALIDVQRQAGLPETRMRMALPEQALSANSVTEW